MYNYSTCYTSRVLTRLIYQARVYAFSVPTRLRVQCTSETLASQGGGTLVYRPHSLPQQNRQLLPSKRAYNTIYISCPWIRLTCTIKLVQTLISERVQISNYLIPPTERYMTATTRSDSQYDLLEGRKLGIIELLLTLYTYLSLSTVY